MMPKLLSAIGLAGLVAACSGAPAASTPPANAAGGAGPTAAAQTASASMVAQGYQGAAAAVDAAYTQWHAAAAGKTRASELAAPAATYAAALTTFDESVDALGASGQTATDIDALVSADRVVIGDLDSVGTQTAADLSHWVSQLTADGAKATQAADTVRSDLGLPSS